MACRSMLTFSACRTSFLSSGAFAPTIAKMLVLSGETVEMVNRPPSSAVAT